MKKRIISLFLVLSMLLCVLPAASAEETLPTFYGTYLTLNESIDINFALTGELPEGYSVKFTVGDTTEAATVVKERDGMPVYTYTGLTPRTLGQIVTATIYNGDEATNITCSKSVLSYCTSMLGKTTTSGNLKTLLVDLLNYGAAFQTYKYDPTDLVNATLTEDQKALATRIVPTMVDDSSLDQEGYDVKFTSVAVSLVNSVLIRFDTNDAAEGKTLKVTDEDGKVLATYTIEGNSTYFDKLNPTQMRQNVIAQVFDGENPVSAKVTYSIEDYAGWAYATTEYENLPQLVKQMMRYGDSCSAWVANPTGTPDAPKVASVEILSGDSVSVILPFTKSATLPITAVAKTAAGNVIEGETLSYEVKDTTVATVDSSGTLTRVIPAGVGDAGTTTLTVSCGNITDTVTVYAVRRWETFDTPNESYSGQAYSNLINVKGTSGVLRSGEGEYARSGLSHAMTQADDVTLRTNSDTFKFYDGSTDLSNKTIAFWIYDMGEITAFKAVLPAAGGLGVDLSVSTDKYIYYAGNQSTDAISTGINRSDGWHEFRFVFGQADENGNGTCKLYIDGDLAAENTNVPIPPTSSADAALTKYHISIGAISSTGAPGIYLEDLIVTYNESETTE